MADRTTHLGRDTTYRQADITLSAFSQIQGFPPAFQILEGYVIGTWGSGSAKWKIPGPSPVQNEACVARPRRVIQLQANAYASTPDYAPPMHGMAIIDPPCTSCRRLFQN